MDRETFYVLEDDTVADPNDVAPDDEGVLRHSSGLAVAVGPHGHRSRSVSAEHAAEHRAAVEAARQAEGDGAGSKKKQAKSPRDREMKAQDGSGTYETR